MSEYTKSKYSDMQPLSRTFDSEETKESYRKVAWFYNSWSKLTEAKAAQLVLQLADIQDGSQIIEVAVGTGLLFQQIVQQNPKGHTVGTDLSEDMLKKAVQHLGNTGDAEQYEFRIEDAYHLSSENDKYDLLVNCFMIDLLPEKDFTPILKEFFRVLRPGGKVIVATFSFGTKPIHKFWTWTARHFPSLLTGCRPVALSPNLVEAGFEHIENHQVSQNTFPAEVIRADKPL